MAFWKVCYLPLLTFGVKRFIVNEDQKLEEIVMNQLLMYLRLRGECHILVININDWERELIFRIIEWIRGMHRYGSWAKLGIQSLN